eukprot:tig00021290_g19966.t1
MLRSQQSFTVSPDSTASCPLERLRALEPFAVPDPGPAEEVTRPAPPGAPRLGIPGCHASGRGIGRGWGCRSCRPKHALGRGPSGAALADVGSALTSESFARGQVNLDGSVRRCGVLQPSDYFWVPPPESGRGTPSAPSSPLAGIIDSAGSAHTLISSSTPPSSSPLLPPLSPALIPPSLPFEQDAEGAPAAYRHTLEAATNTIVLTMDAGQLLALLTPRMRRHAADLAAARRARARWKVAREKIGARYLSE